MLVGKYRGNRLCWLTVPTGNPEISEYFFAGLKLGGALMELSEIYANLYEWSSIRWSSLSLSLSLCILNTCRETILLLVTCKLFENTV